MCGYAWIRMGRTTMRERDTSKRGSYLRIPTNYPKGERADTVVVASLPASTCTPPLPDGRSTHELTPNCAHISVHALRQVRKKRLPGIP